MFWLFAMAIWAAMLILPIVLLIALLPAGRGCPRCGSETLPIQLAWLKPVRQLLQRRWCFACGWEGVSRQGAWQRVGSVPEPLVARRTEQADDDAAWKGGA